MDIVPFKSKADREQDDLKERKKRQLEILHETLDQIKRDIDDGKIDTLVVVTQNGRDSPKSFSFSTHLHSKHVFAGMLEYAKFRVISTCDHHATGIEHGPEDHK